VADAERDHPKDNWTLSFVFQPLSKHVGQTAYANNVLGLGGISGLEGDSIV
jgi:transposase-like protein